MYRTVCHRVLTFLPCIHLGNRFMSLIQETVVRLLLRSLCFNCLTALFIYVCILFIVSICVSIVTLLYWTRCALTSAMTYSYQICKVLSPVKNKWNKNKATRWCPAQNLRRSCKFVLSTISQRHASKQISEVVTGCVALSGVGRYHLVFCHWKWHC